jgi:hypothetical protein
VNARRKAAQKRRTSSTARGPRTLRSSPNKSESSEEHIEKHVEEYLDQSLMESFQASDPPGRPDKNWTTAMRFGKDFKDFCPGVRGNAAEGPREARARTSAGQRLPRRIAGHGRP